MDEYKLALRKVAESEVMSAIVAAAVLLAIIAAVWTANYIYTRKMKRRSPKKYNSEKQIKARRKSLGATVTLTVICVGLGAVLCFGASNTVSEINRDIAESAYVTYTGGYYVSDDSYHSRCKLYGRWLSVDFDNDDCAFIYMNSLFERISTEEGQFEGTVVYGKNSLIVVDMGN